MLSLFSAFSLHFLGVLGGSTRIAFALPCAVSAPTSPETAAIAQMADAADTPEPNAALSGISLASTSAFASLQRQSPVLPPAISANKLPLLWTVNMHLIEYRVA